MILSNFIYIAYFVSQLAWLGLSDEQCESAPAIPIIDIASLLGDNREEKIATAMLIGKACRDIGFFVIINHGVDPQVAENVWNATAEFFDLSTDEKMKYTPISQAGSK
jgi:isopenicillin N synthase-like dioxygenase